MDIIESEVNKGDSFDLVLTLAMLQCSLQALFGSHGKVFAVEPSPHNFDILMKNINYNNFLK